MNTPADFPMNGAIALDHVQLAIPKGGEGRARGGLWYLLNHGELHLGVHPPFSPARKAHPGFRITDIEAPTERLTAANHPFTWDNALTDRKRFFTTDPFENRLEFLEIP